MERCVRCGRPAMCQVGYEDASGWHVVDVCTECLEGVPMMYPTDRTVVIQDWVYDYAEDSFAESLVFYGRYHA